MHFDDFYSIVKPFLKIMHMTKKTCSLAAVVQAITITHMTSVGLVIAISYILQLLIDDISHATTKVFLRTTLIMNSIPVRGQFNGKTGLCYSYITSIIGYNCYYTRPRMNPRSSFNNNDIL